MFSTKDKKQIENRGSKLRTVLNQIENFKKGFPYLEIEEAASVEYGIIRLTEEKIKRQVDNWSNESF